MRYLLILLVLLCSCASQGKISQKQYEKEKKAFNRRQSVLIVVVTGILIVTYIHFTIDDK